MLSSWFTVGRRGAERLSSVPSLPGVLRCICWQVPGLLWWELNLPGAASPGPRAHTFRVALARPHRNLWERQCLCSPKSSLTTLFYSSTPPKSWSVLWLWLQPSGRSKALTETFVSKTQRNYAPFRRESRISGVSPRSFALRPTSSRTGCKDGYSPAASSRSQRLSSACIFRFCSGAADSYARAVCGSSVIVIVAFAMALTFLHFTANILCPLHLRGRPVRLVL